MRNAVVEFSSHFEVLGSIESKFKTHSIRTLKICYGKDPDRTYYVFLKKNLEKIEGYRASFLVYGWYCEGEGVGQIFSKPQLLLRERPTNSNKIYTSSFS